MSDTETFPRTYKKKKKEKEKKQHRVFATSRLWQLWKQDTACSHTGQHRRANNIISVG